jgi:hypothetical protein
MHAASGEVLSSAEVNVGSDRHIECKRCSICHTNGIGGCEYASI